MEGKDLSVTDMQ